MTTVEPLADRFGRVHTSLRIGVTDRCNIRCVYCMPDERVQFKPRAELLTFEEIERFVRLLVPLGVTRLRITGGEPLLRADLPVLVRKLAAIDGVTDIAMTTNGLRLAEYAAELREAGLQRLNISLDGLSESTFQRIAQRRGLDRVLEGIRVARSLGFQKLRINAVALLGITEPEIVPLGRFARREGLELRFIEFMPLGAARPWDAEQVLSGAVTRARLENAFGPLLPAPRDNPSQPAVDYEFADGVGRIGLINPVTEPFCTTCDRLRISAEGQVRNCLFSDVEWDARDLLRGGAGDAEIIALVRQCVQAKKNGRGSDSPGFVAPGRAMHELGG